MVKDQERIGGTDPGAAHWPPTWAKRIRDFSAQVVPKGFTGKIVVNFHEGTDAKINIESTVR